MMKSEEFIKILDENLLLSAENLDQGWRFTSPQDNAWLQKKKITVLPWSSISSDLNPLENQWNELRVRINRWSPKYLQEFERITIKVWKAIPEKTCLNLINVFRKRLLQVIKIRGHATDILILWKMFNFFNVSLCKYFCFFLSSYLSPLILKILPILLNINFILLFCN